MQFLACALYSEITKRKYSYHLRRLTLLQNVASSLGTKAEIQLRTAARRSSVTPTGF